MAYKNPKVLIHKPPCPFAPPVIPPAPLEGEERAERQQHDGEPEPEREPEAKPKRKRKLLP